MEVSDSDPADDPNSLEFSFVYLVKRKLNIQSVPMYGFSAILPKSMTSNF